MSDSVSVPFGVERNRKLWEWLMWIMQNSIYWMISGDNIRFSAEKTHLQAKHYMHSRMKNRPSFPWLTRPIHEMTGLLRKFLVHSQVKPMKASSETFQQAQTKFL